MDARISQGSYKIAILIAIIGVAFILFAVYRTPTGPATPKNSSFNVASHYLKSGSDALNLGAFTIARQEFEHALRFDPTNPHAQRGWFKAELLESLQTHDRKYEPRVLENKIRAFLASQPRDPHALLGLAQLRFASKSGLDQAVGYLKQAIASEDSLAPAYELMGDIYASQDSSEKAVQMYQKAWQLSQEHLPYLSKLSEQSARLLEKRKRESAAPEPRPECRDGAQASEEPVAREVKGDWRIRLTTCRVRENAYAFKKKFEAKYGSKVDLSGSQLRLVPVQQSGRYVYVVQLEGFDSKHAATSLCGTLAAHGEKCAVLGPR
jgi:tetratricopeptide (TPR) repeat protein